MTKNAFFENYNPTLRETLANKLLMDPSTPGARLWNERVVGNLMGTSKAGLADNSIGAADVVPGLGDYMGAEEAYRSGDPTQMGFAAAGLAVPAVAKPLVKGARKVARGAKFLDAPSAGRMPQLADRYPEAGPPMLKNKKTSKPDPSLTPDDVGKTAFEGKLRTPEEDELMEIRREIMADMKANDYERVFDPAQRTDVDPSRYPKSFDTSTVLMKSAKSDEDWRRKVMAPENIQRIKDNYFKGLEFENPDDWYFLGQFEQFARDELGEEAGTAAFRDFAGRMGATTGGMDPDSNLMLAQWVKHAQNKGYPIQIPTHQLPSPIKAGKYGAKTNLGKAQKYFDQGEFGAADPKRSDFQHAFMGHDVSTMDEQMLNNFTIDGVKSPSAPPPGTYGYYGAAARQAADELAAEGADLGAKPVKRLQEVTWHGVKEKDGEPFIETINKAVERTHRITGKPRREILRGMLTGEMPLYGVTGVAGAGMGANALRGEE